LASRLLANEWCVEPCDERALNLIQINCFRLEGLNFFGHIAQNFNVGVDSTAVALIIFGGIKGHFTAINKAKLAGQTLLVGGLAAAAEPAA
jgi:hypothetical protein